MMTRPFPMYTSPKSNRAFTLIELLTVIAIIALLAALLFPAIKSAMLKAETTKARVHISNLETAFKSYQTEYGRWPANEDASSTAPYYSTIFVSSRLIGLLRGEDNSGTIAANTDANPRIVHYNGNPRHIVFLEFKAADFTIPSANITNFVDPWKTVYFCRFDSDYDNQVENPFVTPTTPPTVVKAGFLVWSYGPDAQWDLNGDVPPSPLNKDNVKSW